MSSALPLLHTGKSGRRVTEWPMPESKKRTSMPRRLSDFLSFLPSTIREKGAVLQWSMTALVEVIAKHHFIICVCVIFVRLHLKDLAIALSGNIVWTESV